MGERSTNKVIGGGYMKEERKIITKLLEVEQTNTYKILAEFFARKFSEKIIDNNKEK